MTEAAQAAVEARGADAATPATARTDSSGRNTAVLVLFTAATNLADGMLKVALPLIATSLTNSPALISGVLTTLTLPWLFTALHVGVLVDRGDRRKLLWLANAVRVAVVGGFLAAALAGTLNLAMIYAGGVILGVAEVIALTSAAALLPSLVAAPKRERANSWLTGSETVCNEFLGPFLGGLLVAAGAGIVLGTSAITYAITAATLVFLVGRFRAVQTTAPAGVAAARPAIHAQIVEGLRYLWEQRVLRVMTLLVGVLCSLWGAWLALMPLYATTTMGLSTAAYGLLVGALGAGGTCGAVLVSHCNRLFGRRRVMFGNIFLTGALVAFPAISTNVWVVALGAFLGGLGSGLWVVNSRTVSQTLVNASMMGRYSAAARLFGWGSVPVGAFVAGLLAEWVGVKAAFAVFALIALTVVVPFLRVYSRTVAADMETRISSGAEPPAPGVREHNDGHVDDAHSP
ncbi:Na+/melibiose symporter [Amycolatopsis marina]|uniref:Na+/melibiose symporter n=1 Tax=Amycolatopsis marina TaxID=490629 RepID=A0A1I0YMR0_9PSEU|nr:MFS transporter [Amycolatopsis marina]SFB13760.1 Na+/melibiose symporter [Amycolatopsis marina]